MDFYRRRQRLRKDFDMAYSHERWKNRKVKPGKSPRTKVRGHKIRDQRLPRIRWQN